MLEQQTNNVLKSFGFLFQLVTGSGYGFEINKTNQDGQFDDIVLVGEGKKSAMLPRLCTCTSFGHELCWFGFTTRITKWESSVTKQWRRRYKELTAVLGFTKPQKRKRVDVTASQLVLQLLKQEQPITQKITQVAQSALIRLRDGRQDPHDESLNMWAAAMQDCIYTVQECRKIKMVVSARVFLFIQFLTNEQHQCCVDISKGYKFGGPGFLRTLIQFFH